MEYKEFAQYYDIFYQNKNYENEVKFLRNFINKNDCIIDIGCGTGTHASILEKNGYNVDGLDLNKEMLIIAKYKINGNLYNQNILNINLDKKYDVIISMFAVFNHLKNENELLLALENLKNILSDDGIIIIDLHNPNSSGSKTDIVNNIKRTMIWEYDKDRKIEKTKIIFEVDDKIFDTNHIFRIFSINDICSSCRKIDLEVLNVYENYNINKKGNELSKNLQFVIKKV